MSARRVLWLVLLAVFVLPSFVIAQSEPETVTLRFLVAVPDGTPVSDTVYLCGNDPRMGGWNGEGLALERGDDGVYAASLAFRRGAHVQFKATRGSWQTVEKNALGGEIENRYVVADKDQDVRVSVAAWASGQEARIASTLTGDIRRHDKFESKILGNERTLMVYLPPEYEAQEDARYPVLYMHDGQNIFDAATSFAGHEWRVDEAAEKLIGGGVIEPIIIVGIYNNAERMREYNAGGPDEPGTDYTRFVVEEVKPFIEKTYRADPTSDRTGVAGSSLGGLISLYMVQAHPETFGRCGIVSPALGFEDRQYLDALLAGDNRWLRGKRLWLDMGTMEGGSGSRNLHVQHVRDLAAYFYRAELDGGMDYAYLEVEGGRHNEQAWAGRIEAVLTYLYGR